MTQQLTTSSNMQIVLNKLFSETGVTYNADNNVFLSRGYTSQAGNTYYMAIRLNNRLIVEYDLGDGYMYTFLNGIRLYRFSGRSKVLIAQRCYHCFYFNEYDAAREAAEMLSQYFLQQAKMLGKYICTSEADKVAADIISSIRKQKLIA